MLHLALLTDYLFVIFKALYMCNIYLKILYALFCSCFSGAIQAVQSSNYYPANQMPQTGCYQTQQPTAGLQVVVLLSNLTLIILFLDRTNRTGHV